MSEPLGITHRDPEWRMVWDELDRPLQKEIRRSIRRGEAALVCPLTEAQSAG